MDRGARRSALERAQPGPRGQADQHSRRIQRASRPGIGFAGGVGVELLLDRVGSAGRVQAVEVSSAMLGGAARRFRDEIANGRVELHVASLTDLPLGPAALDGAITINTIYFTADQDRAFSELGRVLRGSGRAVVRSGRFGVDARVADDPHGFRVRPVWEVMDARRARGSTSTTAASGRIPTP